MKKGLLVLEVMFVLILLCYGQVYASTHSSTPAAESVDLSSLSLKSLFKLNISIASFREESELDAGATVSSVDEVTWRRAGAKNIMDLLQFQPGVKKYQTITGAQGLSVRGFTGSIEVARGHALLLDGVSTTTYSFGTGIYAGTFFDLNLMEKVEFLRGPGSVLYGSDAFHSVTSLKSWSSSEDVVEFGARAGNFGYSSSYVRAAYNPTKDVNVIFGVAFVYNHDSAVDYPYVDYSYVDYSYIDNASGDTVVLSNSEKIKKNSMMLKVKVGDFSFVSHRLNFETDEFVGLTKIGLNQEGRRSGAPSNDFNITKIQYDFNVGDGYILSSSAYYLYADKVLDAELGGEEAGNDPDSFVMQIRWPDKKLNARLELKNAQDDIFSWSTGLEFTNHYIDGADSNVIGRPEKFVSAYNGYRRRVRGVWLNTNYRFHRNASLIAGYRIDDYSDLGEIAISPQLGFVFRPNDSSSFKVLYGEAFRAPAATEQAGSSHMLGSYNIKPEVIKTLEFIYMKTSSVYRSNFTLFYSKWDEGITLDITLASIEQGYTEGEYVNTGKNSSRGVEFVFDYYLVSQRLDIKTSASYIRSRNDKDNMDYVGFPETIINWGLVYTLQSHRLIFSLMNRHEFNRRAYADSDADKLDSYFRTDFSLTWLQNEKLELAVNINDLFDRDNINPSAWERDAGLQETGLDASASIRYLF